MDYVYLEYEIRDVTNNRKIDTVFVSKNSKNKFILFDKLCLRNYSDIPVSQLKSEDNSKIAIYKKNHKQIIEKNK